LLAEVLRQESVGRVLVFTRTKRGADKVVRGLAKDGLAAEAIHGNKSQNQRERVLAAFRDGKLRTLVATDIAARGIDVEGISHVVNYDLPNIPESYVHRIGRTARAGADGIAISFCDAEERAYLRDIEKLIRISIPSTDRRNGRHADAAERTNGATAAPPRHQPQQHKAPQRHKAQHTGPHKQRHPQEAHGRQNPGRDQRPHGVRPDQKPAHSQHQGKPNHQAKHQPQHQQHRRDDGRPGRHDDAGIGAVAFMRQPRRGGHRQTAGGSSR
jgi:ATP-dependent RNA helicase RhlE